LVSKRTTKGLDQTAQKTPNGAMCTSTQKAASKQKQIGLNKPKGASEIAVPTAGAHLSQAEEEGVLKKNRVHEKSEIEGKAYIQSIEAALKETNAALKAKLGNFSEMVLVPGGSFTMGCTSGDDTCDDYEKPPHKVELASFKLGRFEVTQAIWRTVMGSDPPFLQFRGCDNCPVEGISFNDIVNDFLPKLNALTGQHFRLPSEAEWEYAARGGKNSRGYKYSGSADASQVAWYAENSANKTHVVGSKEPNELGLFDMSGNVWEWCYDAWHDTYAGAPIDGSAWLSGSDEHRVFRGGAWLVPAEFCRVSDRLWYKPDLYLGNRGFRLAQD